MVVCGERGGPLCGQAMVYKLWGLGPCRDTPRPARTPGPSAVPFLGKPFSCVQPPRGQFPSWVVLARQQDPVWGPGCSVHSDSGDKYTFQPSCRRGKGGSGRLRLLRAGLEPGPWRWCSRPWHQRLPLSATLGVSFKSASPGLHLRPLSGLRAEAQEPAFRPVLETQRPAAPAHPSV